MKDPLYALTTALQPARRAWFQATNRALSHITDSTSVGNVVLVASRLGPGVQQSAIAAELGINAAALVRLLDQAEAAKLLARSHSEGDRRAKGIDLLPAGSALAKEMEVTLIALRQEVFGDLPEEDIETTVRVLRALEERSLNWAKEKDMEER